MKRFKKLLQKTFYKVSELDIAQARVQAEIELDSVQVEANIANGYLAKKEVLVKRATIEHKKFLGDIK